MIEEAKRRHRRRRIGLSLAALALLASVAALLALFAGDRNAAEANLHLGPESSPLLSARVGAEGVRVGVVPNLEPGRPGWCVVALASEPEAFGCRTLLTPRHQFLGGEDWASGPGASYSTSVLLTTAGVRYVSFDGERVGTIAAADVPFALRVAVLRQPRLHYPHIARRGGMPQRRIPIHLPLQLARPANLTVAGRSFSEAEGGQDELPVHYWHLPAAPARGICELHATGLSGLTPRWGGVVTALAAFSGQIGPGLLPCMDTGYSLGAHAIQAAVLLNAADPDGTPPGPIPGFVPIAQAPGFYNSSVACCQGPFTATRDGEAWIIAAGGGPNAEESRLRLLRHLTAKVSP